GTGRTPGSGRHRHRRCPGCGRSPGGRSDAAAPRGRRGPSDLGGTPARAVRTGSPAPPRGERAEPAEPVPAAGGSVARGSAVGRSLLGPSRSQVSRRSVPGRLSRTGAAAPAGGWWVSVRGGRSGPVRSSRSRLGAGLVTVPEVPRPDPAAAVLRDPEVPEDRRYCSGPECGAPVGRSGEAGPGRAEGFCSACGHPFSFVPKLAPGDVLRGQYEVAGPLAHGGLGWIYLARDRALSRRWVVLKGLLDSGDADAMAAAINERRFLAEIEHRTIVRVYNFVEHVDRRTGSRDGYIVMEYVGGRSLKELANGRRTPDGRREPMPVELACAYGLAALDALGHLHSRNLLYCDFKVDNAIQQGNHLKLIDMGAVRRIDDRRSPVYGTPGYQAPEVPEHGASVASDLYTVARTLAVLTFDFSGYRGPYADSLPSPDAVAVFRRYESFYRLLVRATDPDPERRFASAAEMSDQLTGVLREIVALRTGRPRPAASSMFGPETRVVDPELLPPGDGRASVLGERDPRRRRTAARPLPPPAPGGPVHAPATVRPDLRLTALALPVPRVDPQDPNAGFLAGLVATEPEDLLAALGEAPEESVERSLREVRALLELATGPATGSAWHRAADGVLTALARDHGDDWRVVWHRGLLALDDGDLDLAALAFDAVYDAFPGELAPKLALAVCAEQLGQSDNAADYYELVWATDPSHVSAGFGLARVRLALGDRAGAVRALESVPDTSAHWTAARVAGVRARLRQRAPTEPLLPDLRAAAGQLTLLREQGLEPALAERLSCEVLGAALDWLLAGRVGDDRVHAGEERLMPDQPLNETGVRLGLERSYRVLARLAATSGERIELVETANRLRPRTWV
ncbi:tetratricopeptide repeat protein, partial [Streptomyces lonarensis]|uniref:serine/threonine-protein kinase n=1 Tax=Streptomyces lonarensis TaxID=700599 RepID=UPI003B984E82